MTDAEDAEFRARFPLSLGPVTIGTCMNEPVVMEPKPRILVTRAANQGSGLAERLSSLGLEPVLIPALEIVAPDSFAGLDEALGRLDSFDWLLFTSANAVEAFRARVEAVGRGAEGRRPRVAAIGAATGRALETAGWGVDLIPGQAVAESFADALVEVVKRGEGMRFLLVRAEEARDVVPERLRAAGAEITIAAAYRTVIPEDSVARLRELMGPGGTGEIAAITFTSSSAVRNLLALCEAAGARLPEAALRVSIGPITSATLREAGYPPHAEAAEANVGALAEAVYRAVKAAGSRNGTL